jgi:hypothetical protein
MICTKCGKDYPSKGPFNLDVDPLCPSCQQIPTGRYAVYIQGRPFLLRVKRVEVPRRWTTLEVFDPVTGEWVELAEISVRHAVLAHLRIVDLPTASCLYTAMTGICGICGREVENDHDGCLERKFNEGFTAGGS